MIRFEIDPTFAREAVLSGRKLIVEVDPARGTQRVTVGDRSPHDRDAGAIRKRAAA